MLSFYMIYKAIIQKSLTLPYESMFLELNRSEKNFRSIYDTAPLAFVIWDNNFRIIKWNDTAEKMFGWTGDEVLGLNFFDFLLLPEDKPNLQQVIDSLNQGTFSNRNINKNLTKSGKTILCEWNNSVLRDEEGNIDHVLSLALDITEKTKAEEALANESDKIKKFAYSIVHDLKGPSTSLYGLANHLSAKYSGDVDEKARMFCDQIMKVSEQISTLVGEINTFITTKEFPVTIETIDLRKTFTLVREEFSSQLINRNIDWTVPQFLPQMRADRLAITRVVRNFVENALKYGGDGLSKIELNYQDSEDFHFISVTDDGIGLNKEDMDSVFDVFSRHESSRGIAGSGLGLAIVKEVAEQLGGKVWAESRLGKGCSFAISISKQL